MIIFSEVLAWLLILISLIGVKVGRMSSSLVLNNFRRHLSITFNANNTTSRRRNSAPIWLSSMVRDVPLVGIPGGKFDN